MVGEKGGGEEEREKRAKGKKEGNTAESDTFADSGRVEQILSKTSSPYKRQGLPPREKVKQHLIRDKFLSKPKAQKVIDN